MKSACFLSILLFGTMMCVAVPTMASAYELTGIGTKFGFLDAEDRDGTGAIDVNLEFEQPGSRFHLVPGFMYWEDDGLSDKNPNFDVYYHWLSNREVSPYFGSGLGVHMYDSDEGGDRTDLGANLFGGVRFPGQAANLFLEGRYVITDLSQTMIRGGITFNLNHLGH